MDKDVVNNSEVTSIILAHLGDNENKDKYYIVSDWSNLREQPWNTFSTRKGKAGVLASKLYIDRKYEILSNAGNDFHKHDKEWNQKAREYLKAKPKEKILGLENAIDELRISSYRVTTNPLRSRCAQFLREEFDNEQKLKQEEKLFIRWCTISKSN